MILPADMPDDFSRLEIPLTLIATDLHARSEVVFSRGPLKPAIAAMEAASRAEPGCEDYTFSVELNNSGVIRITERWRDMQALAEHFATPHMATFGAAMGAAFWHYYHTKHTPRRAELRETLRALEEKFRP